MRKVFLLIIVLIAGAKGFSQNLYFPPRAYSDSTTLELSMPSLAKALIKQNNGNPASAYFPVITVLPVLQVVAGDYKNALRSLEDQMKPPMKDSLISEVVGFLFRPFILAAVSFEEGNGKSFQTNYDDALQHAYQSLSGETAKMLASEIIGKGEPPLGSMLLGQIAAIRKSGSDSISSQTAINLCEIYLSKKLFEELFRAGKKVFAASIKENYQIEDSVLIQMPDGGNVSATIVKRRGLTGKQPAVLTFNIYPGGDTKKAIDAADKGYIGVVVNTRGKRLSTDTILPFERDAEDAWHIIDWIGKQSWCDGQIGMYGGSYLGFSQWAATKKLHPALKTIVPAVSVAPGVDYPNHNGVFMNYMLSWIHYVVNNKMTDEAEFSDTARWNDLNAKWYKAGASFRSLDSLDERPNAIFQRWIAHPLYDEYWQAMTPQKEEYSKINIPVLSITGYYDDDQPGAFYYYNEHLKWNQRARDNHYLLIGPYTHGGAQAYPAKKVSNYEIDSVASIQIHDVIFNWFDYVMKDSARPEILQDKVNFQVMGENKWRHVSSLEKMNNDTLTFYLSKGEKPGSFKLDTRKPVKNSFINQTVDFRERSFIRFEDNLLAGVDKIIDSVVRSSKDEMVFVSEPLSQQVEINGSVIADIFASVNKKDMDLVMYVFVQEPDGKYFYLNRNLQRASMAKDRTKRQLLQPGKVENIPMTKNYFTSKLVKEGSRIVVALGINKSPAWQVNYGTGKDVSEETIADAGEPLQIKWYNTSTIKIPVWR